MLVYRVASESERASGVYVHALVAPQAQAFQPFPPPRVPQIPARRHRPIRWATAIQCAKPRLTPFALSLSSYNDDYTPVTPLSTDFGNGGFSSWWFHGAINSPPGELSHVWRAGTQGWVIKPAGWNKETIDEILPSCSAVHGPSLSFPRLHATAAPLRAPVLLVHVQCVLFFPFD